MEHKSIITPAKLKLKFPWLPQHPVIDSACSYAHARMPPYLFNHVARSWVFAERLATTEGVHHDPVVLAVSTLLHDIGLTPEGNGKNRFEVNGAMVAAEFARESGMDARQVQLVWDSVALHATPSIALFKEPEVCLCGRGIGVDFGTPDYEAVKGPILDAVLGVLPRCNMLSNFTSTICKLAISNPPATYDNFIKEFGERYVPGYKAPSWVDLILSGPFAE